MKVKQCSICLQFVPLWRSSPATCKSCIPKTPIKSKGTPIGKYTMTSKPSKPKTIAKVSSKQLDRLKAYKKVRDEFMKQHEYCEAQLEGICLGLATDTHHAKGKVGDLLTDSRYFIALCRACHSKIEVSPSLAKELGFSLNRLDK